MITAWDVSALLGSMTLFFALLLSAGKMKSWWERQTGRGDRVGEKCEAAPTAEARLAQAEAKLAELTVQVDELRRQCGQGEPGGQRKRVAAFPLGGIVAWGVPLVGFLVLMYAMAPPPAIRGYLLIVLFFFYGIAGFVLFFSSDWAQQRWNPEGD